MLSNTYKDFIFAQNQCDLFKCGQSKCAAYIYFSFKGHMLLHQKLCSYKLTLFANFAYVSSCVRAASDPATQYRDYN